MGTARNGRAGLDGDADQDQPPILGIEIDALNLSHLDAPQTHGCLGAETGHGIRGLEDVALPPGRIPGEPHRCIHHRGAQEQREQAGSQRVSAILQCVISSAGHGRLPAGVHFSGMRADSAERTPAALALKKIADEIVRKSGDLVHRADDDDPLVGEHRDAG